MTAFRLPNSIRSVLHGCLRRIDASPPGELRAAALARRTAELGRQREALRRLRERIDAASDPERLEVLYTERLRDLNFEAERLKARRVL